MVHGAQPADGVFSRYISRLQTSYIVQSQMLTCNSGIWEIHRERRLQKWIKTEKRAGRRGSPSIKPTEQGNGLMCESEASVWFSSILESILMFMANRWPGVQPQSYSTKQEHTEALRLGWGAQHATFSVPDSVLTAGLFVEWGFSWGWMQIGVQSPGTGLGRGPPGVKETKVVSEEAMGAELASPSHHDAGPKESRELCLWPQSSGVILGGRSLQHWVVLRNTQCSSQWILPPTSWNIPETRNPGKESPISTPQPPRFSLSPQFASNPGS